MNFKCPFCTKMFEANDKVHTCYNHTGRIFRIRARDYYLAYSIDITYKEIFFGFDSCVFTNDDGCFINNTKILFLNSCSGSVKKIYELGYFTPLPENEESLQKILDRYINLKAFL